MKYFALLALVTSFSVSAAEMKLNCLGMLNGETVFQEQVNLAEGSRNMIIGMVGDHDIMLSSLGGQKVELQAYNPIAPSRSYATATLSQESNKVELAIWTRDFWIEAHCSLN